MATPFYGTVAAFRAYFTERGKDVSALLDGNISASLVVASEWLDATFRGQFPGLKVGMRAQVREWPRNGATDVYGYVIDMTVPPIEVEQATYQAAYNDATVQGVMSAPFQPSQYKSVSVSGAVAVDFASFFDASEAQKQFPIISEILTPVLIGSLAGSARYSGSTVRA